jgi:prepilin-type N-terminal cleavage/methylation domain-containing protein
MSFASQRPHSVRTRGFSLVEIMVVVVIIGLLAALAIPAFQRNQRASQNARAINDFRIFVQAFEVYNTQNGSWPADSGGGVVPTGMSGDFKEDAWTMARNSLGGRWNWDTNRTWANAAVSVTNFTVVDEQLQEMDAKLDDGNLTTGFFQKVAANRVSYIIEPP